jgi:deoxyribodipyrimidine photolyase-related protein
MRVGLILGDQLSEALPTLQQLDRHKDLLLMAEVADEARYAPHHKQKIVLIFSAMRHFAEELRESGWRVNYIEFNAHSRCQSLLDAVHQLTEQHGHDIDELVVTEPGEYRLHSAISELWPAALLMPINILPDTRFICSKSEFAQWADGRKQLRMEYFYRQMRQSTGLLMSAGKPIGGQWNFDADNRNPYAGDPPLPAPFRFEPDDIDRAVITLVNADFASHPGLTTGFNWPTSRRRALAALDHFIEGGLPYFGDYQDAMVQSQQTLFHSLLSTSMNCGLLTPLEVCQRAEAAYLDGSAPLNAVEGFIRQIIGWREYVRGLYWLQMPAYAAMNHFGNSRSLPAFYWSGETAMNCMRECFSNTFQNAYAHHIQRLMVTGNFALLAGIVPEQICEWYLAVYADAYDWVELPNTLGMVMHADGGIMASKPYAASGNYIHKMSDYCRHCRYNVKTSTEADSCPFNSLYWHFIARHQEQLQHNPRMTMIYRSFEKMTTEKKVALLQRAEHLLDTIEQL